MQTYPFTTSVDGYSVMVAEPAPMPTSPKPWAPTHYKNIFRLSLSTGQTTFGCWHCGFTHDAKNRVAIHLGEHKEPRPRMRKGGKVIVFGPAQHQENHRVWTEKQSECEHARILGVPLPTILAAEENNAFEEDLARSEIILGPAGSPMTTAEIVAAAFEEARRIIDVELPRLPEDEVEDFEVDTADIVAMVKDYPLVRKQLAEQREANARLLLELDEHRERWSHVVEAVRLARA